MEQQKKDAMTQYAERCSALCYENDAIDDALFDQHHVFRGLRDRQGRGVVTGITNISRVDGRKKENGREVYWHTG